MKMERLNKNLWMKFSAKLKWTYPQNDKNRMRVKGKANEWGGRERGRVESPLFSPLLFLN